MQRHKGKCGWKAEVLCDMIFEKEKAPITM